MSDEHEFWVNATEAGFQWECTCGDHGAFLRVRAVAQDEGQEHMDWKHP